MSSDIKVLVLFLDDALVASVSKILLNEPFKSRVEFNDGVISSTLTLTLKDTGLVSEVPSSHTKSLLGVGVASREILYEPVVPSVVEPFGAIEALALEKVTL